MTGETRYVVEHEVSFVWDAEQEVFRAERAAQFDIQMADGAAVRIKGVNYDKTGLRFETKIAATTIKELVNALKAGKYYSVSFGTLIARTSDLMGGQFTHEWLDKNGKQFANIPCTVTIDANGCGQFPTDDGVYYSFYGSLVKLYEHNYTQWFSGVGYIQIVVEKDAKPIYFYAPYNATNSRSMAYVSNAAIKDRSDSYIEHQYDYPVEGKYSPYTAEQNTFLEGYIKIDEETETVHITTAQSFNLAKGDSRSIELNKKLKDDQKSLTKIINRKKNLNETKRLLELSNDIIDLTKLSQTNIEIQSLDYKEQKIRQTIDSVLNQIKLSSNDG
jgi:hypothetical protein